MALLGHLVARLDSCRQTSAHQWVNEPVEAKSFIWREKPRLEEHQLSAAKSAHQIRIRSSCETALSLACVVRGSINCIIAIAVPIVSSNMSIYTSRHWRRTDTHSFNFFKTSDFLLQNLIPDRLGLLIPTPTSDDGDETYDGQPLLLTTKNTLRWQMDYDEHKNAKENMKLASKLLHSCISDGIKMEIEDCADAKDTYYFIKKRYAVTNERVRHILLKD
ncbi:uncharacterized protein N7446_007490 [Penicillium canescens]|uniref:uncharacterized protein n=1 Tax=Penicillium canescens TaxID=5083 RepID=UPI0026DF1577|nr:uncharacterized protein N7446_007490 [Penicillium canescens]KAJ6063370.1 hypothetical protein N7446_007490 [Penicillium canescens]